MALADETQDTADPGHLEAAAADDTAALIAHLDELEALAAASQGPDAGRRRVLIASAKRNALEVATRLAQLEAGCSAAALALQAVRRRRS